MKKLLVLFIFLFLIVLSSCANKLNPYTKTFFVFSTEVNITIYDKDKKHAEESLKYANEILSIYNKLCDRYTDYSNTLGVYYLNKNAGETIKIDPRLYDLLKYSVANSQNILNSDNKPVFSIGIGKVSDIYHDLFENHNKETIEHIDINTDINTTTDSSLIEFLDDNYVKIPNGMSVDLGGVAKGYAINILKEYYNQNDIKYVMDAGNSSIVTNYGNPSRKNSVYKIGLRNPELNKNDSVFGILDLDLNVVASTTAYYQKYFIMDNTIYSSILDPYTYKPVDTDILSITVLSFNASIGDILSTSLYMIGYDEAIKYDIENDDISLIIYKNDGSIYVSETLLSNNKFQYK